jgi:hypothetical protein
MIWLQSDEKVPKRERHTIQAKKVMLTMVFAMAVNSTRAIM